MVKFIDEVKQKKLNLEEILAKLLAEFSSETGLRISDMQFIDATKPTAKEEKFIYIVRIEAKL